MKIVYFIDHLRPDGAQMVLSQLVTGLAARGHDQTVICLNDSWDDMLLDCLHCAGASVQIVGKAALAGGYGLFSVWHCLYRSHFDVAITLLFVSDVIGRLLAKCAGVPRIISSIRTRNIDYSPLQRSLVRGTMKWADAVIINSRYVREFAILKEGAHPDRIFVIPNGVRVDDYASPMGQSLLRAQMGLPASSCLVGGVGRLTWQKGFDVMLRARALLPKELSLLIFGVGEKETSLRTLADKLGLQSSVRFAGYRRDIPSLLGALDLYVHPARFEGMPNALLEAMAAACPIVATSVDGNRDLIEDGMHGWLVPPDDPVMLAKAIDEALSDPNEARRRGAAARQRVASHFNIEAMVLAWENVLRGTHRTV